MRPDLGASGSLEYADNRLHIESVGEGSGGATRLSGTAGCAVAPTGRLGIAIDTFDDEMGGGEVNWGVPGPKEGGRGVPGFEEDEEPTGLRAMLLTLLSSSSNLGEGNAGICN